MININNFLPKRFFGFNCSQVDAYIEELLKQKEAELHDSSEKIEAVLKKNQDLLIKINTLLGTYQSERAASERIISELLDMVEEQIRVDFEAKKVIEEEVVTRRLRVAELEKKYENLTNIINSLEDNIENIDGLFRLS